MPAPKLHSLLLLFCLSFASSDGLAATLTVPAQHADIQAALVAASPGDTVLVSPGTYVGGIDYAGKDVTVRSTGGPKNTTIDGDLGTGVQIGPGGALVGFTITNSSASFGAGTAVHGSGSLIQGNVYDTNHQGAGGYGAAIGGNVASPVIMQNIFRSNSCDSQLLSGVVAFINGSSPRIVNNVFEDNPCRAVNLTLPIGNTPEVINNTMVRNRTGIKIFSMHTVAGEEYRNNVLVDNDIGLEVGTEGPTDDFVWENNLVFGNETNYDNIPDQTGSNGNISVNPLFENQAGGDYRLMPQSPALDAGGMAGAPLEDLDGNPRPVGAIVDGEAAWDIGAYEFVPPTDAVGGNTLGMRLFWVLCNNATTGEYAVSLPGLSKSWDCEDAGLTVNSGDIIRLLPIGVAE